MASARPALPAHCQNPHLADLDLAKWPPVKYQSLDRDGHQVLVGRLKIPTPTGHAFILRRYDTGAISLTTMFRAAFPDATELDERKETQWAKETFNLAGNNGSARDPAVVRLAGTWISPTDASRPVFADAYALRDVVAHIAGASPDPKATYRRSAAKAPRAAPSSPVPSPGKALLTPAPSMTMPTPKRRREASLPRRAARTRSPAPPTSPTSVPVRIARAVRVEVTTPAGSDETVVEDEAEAVELAKPSMTQDVAEQKELIDRLKAEREVQPMQTDEAETLKRERDDDSKELRFEFKEPEPEARQIATNKRVSRLEPRTKSLAWGVAAFAIGMGAVSFLPNLF